MNRQEAYIIDSKTGEFYAEWDDASGGYGVFGTETGFCYTLRSDMEQAKGAAEAMNRQKNKPKF